MKQDRTSPRRQAVTWSDGHSIELIQNGHDGWRLLEYEGISLQRNMRFNDAQMAQAAFIDAQVRYLDALAEFTLAPLPTSPSQIIKIREDDVPDVAGVYPVAKMEDGLSWATVGNATEIGGT